MVIWYVVFILLILIPGGKSDLITTTTEPPNTELPTSTFEDSTTELLATEQDELLPKISGNVMGSLVHEHPLQLTNYTTERFDGNCMDFVSFMFYEFLHKLKITFRLVKLE